MQGSHFLLQVGLITLMVPKAGALVLEGAQMVADVGGEHLAVTIMLALHTGLIPILTLILDLSRGNLRVHNVIMGSKMDSTDRMQE